MLIRSQNKKAIINLDNIDTISFVREMIKVFNGGDDIGFDIGTYSTEEKAIKVLDMIQNAYTQYGTIKDGLGNVHGAFNVPKCFQMPQDDEVEV